MKTTILPTTTTKNRTEPKFKSARGVTGQLLSWASMNRPPWRRRFVLIALILTGFAVSPSVLAVVPAPDGGYPGANTAEGDDALFSLTTGVENTAVGFQALYSSTDTDHNTAVGFQALANSTQYDNTGVGYHALWQNTFGYGNTAFGVDSIALNSNGSFNTAAGFQALVNNDSDDNTAYGAQALYSNTTGVDNTASGAEALFSNTTGSGSTATGFQALLSNTTGSGTAVGSGALLSNTVGTRNVAVGAAALESLTSGEMNTAVGNLALQFGDSVNFNTALGRRALGHTQGDQNTGLGFFAGWNLSGGGTNNIYIGNAGPVPIGTESNTIRLGTQTATTVTAPGPPFESHPMPAHTATFIAGISGTAVTGRPVMINANGKVGTPPSAARFKEEIKPMDKASEAILALKPVTFRYKKEVDAERTPQFGLIAEDVEKVNPALVARDDHGKPFTVRYEAVNAMLLNEFLKEHKAFLEGKRKVQELEAKATRQQKQIDALTAGLQKVSAQLELNKSAPQTVLNDQ